MFDVDAVVFDFDGTLVEPSIDFEQMRQAVLRVIDTFGLDSAPYAPLHTLEAISSVKRRLAADGPDRVKVFDRAAAQAVIDIEVAAARRTRPYVGAPEMLSTLSARGYGVAIVTRNCRAAVETVLSDHPLYFDVLLTRDDVTKVKPDPEHLLAALRPLGVAGARALMCGDHAMDITAGKRIGARAVGVIPPGAGPDRFADVSPDLILERVSDLVHYVNGRRQA